MPRIFSPLTGQPADPTTHQPNADALGVSGAGHDGDGWRFSIITADEVIGTTRQELVKSSKRHLHLGESEITSYWANAHGLGGLLGNVIVNNGTPHCIEKVVGGSESVTTREAQEFLDGFCCYNSTDPSAPIARADGTSAIGTGAIVDIFGRPCKAGGGLPIADAVLNTSAGGRVAIQIKTLSSTTTTKAERLTHAGLQLLHATEHGRDLVLMLAVRDAQGHMTVEWINAGAIIRMQMDASGESLEGGEFPLSAPDGGTGKMKRGGSPFYLKGARGGTRTKRIAPRQPMVFSIAGLRRFLASLPAETRAQVSTKPAPFSPDSLPAWIGSCIY
jgi:hypothetical protein